jgi:7-keto-8-aminopelargonate synthetase-like enzyme
MTDFREHLEAQLKAIRDAGTYKKERVITTRQCTSIRVSDGKPVLNLCANNYLGLAQHPAIAQAARESIDRWGYGMASVRSSAARSPFTRCWSNASPHFRHGRYYSLLVLLRRERWPI